MKRFWWLAAIVFIPSLVIYAVGDGWITDTAVKGSVNHARRQIEPSVVVRDLQKAQMALRQHVQRVQSISFALPGPDLAPTYQLSNDLGVAQRQFESMIQMQDAAGSMQYQNAIRMLKSYRIPSTSVLSSSQEMFLMVLTIVSGLLAIGSSAARIIGGAD